MPTEIQCLYDLDEFGTEITDPAEELYQDLVHRIITPPGQNIDDPDNGLGIDGLLSGSNADLISLGPRIEAELRKDDRVADVRALVTPLGRGVYSIRIAVVPDSNVIQTAEEELYLEFRSGTNGTELVA